MAIYIHDRDGLPVTTQGKAWVQKCLIRNGSMLRDDILWDPENLKLLDEYFVQRLDAGTGSFYEKLEAQLEPSPAKAKQLMAEILWALFLFPSNISIETKRESIVKVWGWSGESLDPTHPMLAGPVLNGIGSGGPGINNHRWRELVYMIGLATNIKKLDPDSRQAKFADYESFVNWIDTVPQEGERQFRQMLRYLLFPERVERLSSNGDRIRILVGFERATAKEARKWSDVKLDTALLQLRNEKEVQYATQDLDFYCPPLREIWKAENEPDDPPAGDTGLGGGAAEERAKYSTLPVKPRNLILYGPPGTGKTFRLQQMFHTYTDQPADVDRVTWELGLVGQFGWRAVIAAALATKGQPMKVPELAAHPLIKAKARERERTKDIRPTLWGYLQEHTPHDVVTVNISVRRPPFVFTKSSSSDWSLVADWRDADSEAADLADAWGKGPGDNQKPVQRYRVVTFHPSYSYEDFVIGLRPLVMEDGEDHASTEFRMVDGVFKQICAQAKANPKKRYALFIDEINRANIAKVFGELITLIEGDKRACYDEEGGLTAGLEVQLPGTNGENGSDYRFGVPANLDIYGTMNTADRSIALLDIALRRRFEFEELPPNYELVNRSLDGVELGKLLRRINDRLEYLSDRDRQIGHAYFMKAKSLTDLRDCFRLQIIPLLQEFFFDDWSRVQLVLSKKDGGSPFIARQQLAGAKLFSAGDDTVQEDRVRYTPTDPATWDAAAFQSLYESSLPIDPGQAS